jgi:hypothetical protein
MAERPGETPQISHVRHFKFDGTALIPQTSLSESATQKPDAQTTDYLELPRVTRRIRIIRTEEE